MSPLYLFNGKLLIKDSKLATNANCCCPTFTCKITKCGCDEYQYNATFTKLWLDIQEWIDAEEYTCNNNPVDCGQWKPKLINGVPQRDCCSQACYDIWNHILSHVGYTQEIIDSKSPSELDTLCSSITVEPTFFPTDKNNPDISLFDNISYNDRYHIKVIDTKHKAGELDSPCLPSNTERLCFDLTLQSVTFATLVGDGTLTANIDSNALDLLKTGSCLPHEKTTNYTNAAECRNCYGALFKLGTYDYFGRTEANTDFMNAILINTNSGDIKSSTDFSFGTTSKLTPTDCITKKFPGTDPINPYGILTNQLTDQPLVNTETTDNYFQFDLRYKYEISWDNTNWYAATNKWTVKYGSQPNNTPSFSFEGDVNNYYQNNIPQPISASISNLDFDPVTISTKISVGWGGNGITIGNSDCSFSDSKLSKIGETRSIPSLTVSSDTPSTDCTFTPVLQQLSEPNGAPYWTISSVNIVCNDEKYTIGESLKVTIGNGDMEEIKAELKINSGDRTSPTLTISGGGGNGATFTPTLSSAGSPTVWSLSGGSASGGSGYVTGTSLTITTNPEDVTITPAKATVLARGEPSISASASNGNGAVLSVQLSQTGSPPIWGVSKVDVTNGGTNYVNNSNIIFTTSDNIVTNASAKLLTTSLPPVLSIGEYVIAGSGAQFQINIFGPNQYPGNCSFPDYYEIDIVIVNGGNGYDPNTDSFTLILDPDTTVASNSINSGIELPIVYSVDSNGTIISIDGLLDPDSFEVLPLYLFLFWKPSGIIKCIKVTNGGQYYSDTGAAYGISVVDGGQYYKPGTPVVEIINGGKYYHLEAPYARAVSGPCIDNIKMDIWHPGPCGISEELKIQTSTNTPWDGYYYGDLVQNVYRKFWLWQAYYGIIPEGQCPCCKPVDFLFGVVKLEGCENFTIDKNYDIPLEQWEIDFNYCDLLTTDLKIYKRYCFSNNYRYNCCAPMDSCGSNPTDYRYNGYDCVPGSPLYPSEQCPLRDGGTPFVGGFALNSGIITCEDMTPNQYPNYYPDYWQYCAVITKENAPWKKTNINCP